MRNPLKEVHVKIDIETIKRHGALYVDGDYSRIAASANSTPATVSRCLQKSKSAAISLAREMKKFYLEKEQVVEELNS